MAFKITYSVQNADMTELNKVYEKTYKEQTLKTGQEFPSWLGYEPVKTGQFIEDRNPANTDELLAKFHIFPESLIDKLFEKSRQAQKTWYKMPWKDKVKLMRKAADLISERNMEMATIVSMEVGKSRLEALGDVEEGADLRPVLWHGRNPFIN